MKRRGALRALVVLGGAAPAVARAQPAPKVWRIGYLGPSRDTAPQLLGAFQEGLAGFGYVEGRNLAIEYRWTNAGTSMNDPAVLRAHARELVALKVDVLVASIDPAIRAASEVTSTVPIVMLNASDPVALGFIKAIARPGGNITGMTRLSPELVAKNMQVLLEATPHATRLGLLVNSSNSVNESISGNAQQAARARAVALQVFDLRAATDLDAIFAAMKRAGVQALVVADTGAGVFWTDRTRLAELALAQRLPAIYANTEIVEAGGLMAYSPSSVEHYRHAAAFIDKLLRGQKPADIPVEQPTKFELVINTRTARALNLPLPQSLLIRADRLIE